VSDAKATPEQIIRLLTERRQTLAVAESSTGGLIGHLLTEVPGSSEVFLGGVIAYANAIKEKLGVPAEVIQRHGAVSAQVAGALATTVLRWADADYGLAVTGIAGPGGATETKPVGLVYIGLAGKGRLDVEQHHFAGDRSAVKRSTAEAALLLLTNTLMRGSEIAPEPHDAP
jgi:PncC family amidohydrolase